MRTGAVVLLAVVLLAAALVACGPPPAGADASVALADGSQALAWGDGPYGVVLVTGEGEMPAGWAGLAQEMAANGMTALATHPDGVDAERLAAAAEWLAGRAVQRVAFVTSLRSGAVAVADRARAGGAIDQLIAISADLTEDDLAALGEPPKLFVAAVDDASAEPAERMTDAAPGAWNALLLVPGAGSGLAILETDGGPDLIAGVVARLEERR